MKGLPSYAEVTRASGTPGAFLNREARRAKPRFTEPPLMILAGHTVEPREIHPADWAGRVTDMAGAYADPRHDHYPQVVECRACPNRHCVMIGRSVPQADPGLLADLLLVAHLAGAMDFTEQCPQNQPGAALPER